MARTVAAAMLTDLSAASIEMIWLIDITMSAGTEYYTTGGYDIQWNGNTYEAGIAMGFSPIQEQTRLEGQGVRISFTGVDTKVIDDILGQDTIGREIQIRRAHVDKTTGAIIADPIAFGPWLLNGPWEIEHQSDPLGGPATATVKTTAVSKLTMLNQRRGIMMNTTSHQQHFNGDTGFSHVTQNASVGLFWGSENRIGRQGGGGTQPSGGDDETEFDTTIAG